MKNLLNLYTDELRERPIPYGFSWLVGAVASMALLMLAQGAYTQHRLAGMDADNRALQERQQLLNTSIATLEAKIATQDQLDMIERESAALHQDIQGRERVLAELMALVERSAEGFSRSLHGLASASGQGVWLTDIHLAAAGSGQPLAEVRLTGRMHQGDRLPHYIDALARAEALRGLRFNSMQALRADPATGPDAQRAPAKDNAIIFMISTRADDLLQEGKPQ